MSKELQPGDAAPTFSAVAVGGDYGAGKTIALTDLRGTPVVLYFYPKDDTPGCTAQACDLRDRWSEVREKACIFGVSPDSAQSHQKFLEKHALPFPLLVDESKEIASAYGVWVEKSMYGKKYLGVERTTYVINSDGKITAVFRKVKPAEHVGELLKVL